LCGRQNHESENGAAGAEFSRSTTRNCSLGAGRRDSPEISLSGAEVETIAGDSGKLQFRTPRTNSDLWCIAPAPWHSSFVAADAAARPQFWPAQSGAQLGATRRATIVIRLNACSRQLAIRIRIAFSILLLRYAGRQLAST